MTVENFMPILFKVLFAFVIMNMIINLVLLYTKRSKVYKLLALYWPSVFMVFILQSIFQKGNLEVALSFAPTFFSMSIFAYVGFEVLGRNFPFKKYFLFFLGMLPLTLILNHFGAGFASLAMPIVIAAVSPVFHFCYYVLIVDRKKTTKLQVILGFVGLLMIIHNFNFAFFRMDPGAQLWGWLVAYALYDCLAILLPSIALEGFALSESARLQKLVDQKTAELNESLKENNHLLGVLIHDLASPLMTLRFYLSRMNPAPDQEELLEKSRKSMSVLDKILLDVRSLYGKKKNYKSFYLNPFDINDSFNELSLIFSPRLERKNIKLVLNNQLRPGTKLLSDPTSLTHSVLSNLVNNSLKFSEPGSTIEIVATEVDNSIKLTVKDKGPGIPPEVIEKFKKQEEISAASGTHGELGTGLGLSIVRSFVKSYGGTIEFFSRPKDIHPDNHGTEIAITLEKA